ncbi:MAG TPA: HlyD family efflux transporter periplasmic adaptor subunit [Chloroflexota bacterium]
MSVEEPPGAPSAASTPTSPELANGAAGLVPQRSNARSRLRRILPVVGLIALLVVGLVAFNVYWEGANFVSTDNAQVSGQTISVGSINAGRVTAIGVGIGAVVRKDQVIAEIALPSEVGLTQSGGPRMDFLGDADSRVSVRSPIDGVVIAVPGAVGATIAQGQSLVTLVDPAQLWVNANVDETKVGRVRAGQEADVHIDASDVTVTGYVIAITPATAATFSLLPQSNTTGNFTKVAQVIPVRIAVNLGAQTGLLGSSASVKIHVT